ncbi:hypothetical protein [Georgenia muralis]|uniref:hypothetical protein n=1 Tax=Georgenia muralis TaxID=154117 RepID=UPI000F4E2389|nr:hypothetical protein [Georgenia muralis]
MTTPSEIAELTRLQAGAVSRRQLVEVGFAPGHLAEKVSSGAWQRLYPGVAVTHSGPVPWRTRTFGALLYAGPGAALSHRSAAFVWGLTVDAPRVLDIAVPWRRRVVHQPGLRIRRRRCMPPVLGPLAAVLPAEAVLDVWEELTTVDDRVALLATAARAHVTVTEISRASRGRGRLRGRSLLTDLLTETGAGVESPMEHRYVRDVARRHGLPPCRLQKRDVVDGRRIRSDGWYPEFAVAGRDGRAARASRWADGRRHVAGQRGAPRARRADPALPVVAHRR